jgi:signal transduction histidine kinase
MCGMGRVLGGLAVCAVAAAVGVYTLALVRRSPEFSFAGASPAGALALLAAGWALIGAGVAFWVRRPASRFGPLLASAGYAWFLLEWNNPGTRSAFVFTIGLCLYAACPALVGHAVLVYPAGRLRSVTERAVVAVAYAGGVLVLGLVPAVLFDPLAQGCGQCPRNLVLVADRGQAATDLRRIGVYFAAGWALALCTLVLARLARARRRPGWPVLAAGGAYLALVTATFAASGNRGLLWNGTLERRLWLSEAAALVFVAAWVALSRVRSRRARSTVAHLVLELAQAPPPGGLRDVLAQIVGDSELVLAYPVGDSGGPVDVDGRTADPASCPAQTSVVRDGRTVAVLGHAAGLLDDEDLLEQVAAAARLALENERLQAEVRARLEELRASRSRIVATSDAERRRLERDLHDGAQQRMVALALSLRLMRSRLSSDDPQVIAKLRDAEADLDRAIAELRELAHGIFPAVLADAGLAVAVRALAEDGPVPIHASGLPERRFAPAVETAAYTVVAEAARAATTALAVRGSERDGLLVVEVETAGAERSLDGLSLEDRVGAIDGRLAVERGRDGRVRIRAEFPCGS